MEKEDRKLGKDVLYQDTDKCVRRKHEDFAYVTLLSLELAENEI